MKIQCFSILAAVIQCAETFLIDDTTIRSTRPKHTIARMGKGWGNDDFLGSLGGNDEDRGTAKEKYEQFKKSREDFDERQRERMESAAGQKFMQQREEMAQNQREEREALNCDDDPDGTGEFFRDFGLEGMPGFGGEGNRFSNMMRQSSGGPRMGMDFEQKLAVPLDDDDSDENNTDDD